MLLLKKKYNYPSRRRLQEIQLSSYKKKKEKTRTRGRHVVCKNQYRKGWRRILWNVFCMFIYLYLLCLIVIVLFVKNKIALSVEGTWFCCWYKRTPKYTIRTYAYPRERYKSQCCPLLKCLNVCIYDIMLWSREESGSCQRHLMKLLVLWWMMMMLSSFLQYCTWWKQTKHC